MNQNSFRAMIQRIRGSGFVLPLYYTLWVCFGLAIIASLFDFYTSLLGVRQIPIRQFDMAILNWVRVITVALMPQVSSIIAGYVVVMLEPSTEAEKEIRTAAKVILVLSVFVSIVTGYAFYVRDWSNPVDHAWAFVMAGIVDTLFSELGLVVSYGMLRELAPDARRMRQRLARPRDQRAQPQRERTGDRRADPYPTRDRTAEPA